MSLFSQESVPTKLHHSRKSNLGFDRKTDKKTYNTQKLDRYWIFNKIKPNFNECKFPYTCVVQPTYKKVYLQYQTQLSSAKQNTPKILYDVKSVKTGSADTGTVLTYFYNI